MFSAKSQAQRTRAGITPKISAIGRIRKYESIRLIATKTNIMEKSIPPIGGSNFLAGAQMGSVIWLTKARAG